MTTGKYVPMWAETAPGESLSWEEEATLGDFNVVGSGMLPNSIEYSRLYVGDAVERIKFAGGAVFVRERTCHNVSRLTNEFKCSECGYQYIAVVLPPGRYCSECGARIEEVGEWASGI